MKLPAVELQTDDGKHEDGEEQKEADLKQRDHGLHDGLQHNLQALKDRARSTLLGNLDLDQLHCFCLSIQLKLDADKNPSL